MIQNFEEVKEQLRELAEIVNAFSSEAVQLRIVELIFGIQQDQEIENSSNDENAPDGNARPPPPRKKNRRKAASQSSQETPTKKKPAATGNGPVATLVNLTQGTFFDTPQSMKSIIEHCEVNLARKIKQTDISGKLARLVRDGTLKRAKNTDGQYEYRKT